VEPILYEGYCAVVVVVLCRNQISNNIYLFGSLALLRHASESETADPTNRELPRLENPAGVES
jgi:hypothetical protein